MLLRTLFILLLACATNFAFCQTAGSSTVRVAADSVAQVSQADLAPPDDEFAPLLFLAAFGLLCLGIVAAGAVAGAGIMFILFILISAGVISISVASAFYKRSLLTGFRVLVLSAMSILGILAGLSIMAACNYLFNLNISTRYVLLTGATGGLAGGLLLGALIVFIVRSALKTIQERVASKLQ